MVALKSLEAVLAFPGLHGSLSVGTGIIITVLQHLIIGPLVAPLLSAHTDSTSSMTCLNTCQAAITRIPWNVEANIEGPQSAHSSRLVYAAGSHESLVAVILGIESRNCWDVRSMEEFGFFLFYSPRRCFQNKIHFFWVRWKRVDIFLSC